MNDLSVFNHGPQVTLMEGVHNDTVIYRFSYVLVSIQRSRSFPCDRFGRFAVALTAKGWYPEHHLTDQNFKTISVKNYG